MDKSSDVPPLDERRFNASFTHFCNIKRLGLDQQLLQIGGRQLDLHALHQGFVSHKGYDAERGPSFWLMIGTWLHFIRPQDTGPASFAVADRLSTIYSRYLEEFDTIYVMSYRQELEKRVMHGRR